LQETGKFAGADSGFMTALMNMYDAIRANLHFNKFAVGAAFRRVQMPIEQDAAGEWMPTNRMPFDLPIKQN